MFYKIKLYWRAYRETKEFIILIKRKGSVCWSKLYLRVLNFIEELKKDPDTGGVINELYKEGEEAFDAVKKIIKIWK